MRVWLCYLSGDDGKVYSCVNFSENRSFGPTFADGDIVGAGINLSKNQAFCK